MARILCDDDDGAILCSVSGGFTPLQNSKIVDWLRVPTVGPVSTLPSVMGRTAATAALGAEPTVGTTTNGLPFMQFDGTKFLSHALQSAVNNNSAFFCMHMWLRSPLNTVSRYIYSARAGAGQASLHRLSWQAAGGEDTLADIHWDNATIRRTRSNVAVVLGPWEFHSLEIQCALSGDARCVQRKNGVAYAQTYSLDTEMPPSLVTPTGFALIGANSTAPGSPWIGDMRDIFFANDPFTPEEFTNIMTFEQPAD